VIFQVQHWDHLLGTLSSAGAFISQTLKLNDETSRDHYKRLGSPKISGERHWLYSTIGHGH
jgi:hypothetical protein